MHINLCQAKTTPTLFLLLSDFTIQYQDNRWRLSIWFFFLLPSYSVVMYLIISQARQKEGTRARRTRTINTRRKTKKVPSRKCLCTRGCMCVDTCAWDKRGLPILGKEEKKDTWWRSKGGGGGGMGTHTSKRRWCEGKWAATRKRGCGGPPVCVCSEWVVAGERFIWLEKKKEKKKRVG